MVMLCDMSLAQVILGFSAILPVETSWHGKTIRMTHDDVIKWKHFPRYWPFVRGIHRPPVNSRIKASDAELWCFLWAALWINGWVNNREAGDLRRRHAHYDLIVMVALCAKSMTWSFVVFGCCCYVTKSRLLPVIRDAMTFMWHHCNDSSM